MRPDPNYKFRDDPGMPYKVSPNPVFFSFQGEGHLRGFQMAFVRLSGCSVGCRNCDTDYSNESEKSALELAELALSVTPSIQRDKWVWITGGEPTDQDLEPLICELKKKGLSVALATSGCRRFIPPVDWLSVSPHDLNTRQLYGSEIKLVDGLNGLSLDRWIEKFPNEMTEFYYRYAQPLSIEGEEVEASIDRCKKFALSRPNWALSRQDHLHWGVS